MKKVLLAFLFVSLGCCGLFAVKAVSDITDELYNIRSVYSEKIAVESVTLSPSAVTMNVGESVAMTAKINPAGAVAELEWVSSDPLVASVMSDGTVVANGPGVCEITVSALDESLFTASCMVNVTEPSGAACMTFVDMGTSVLWGSQPLGVDAGHPYGQLYRPGAVDPVPSGKSYFSGWGVEDNEWGGNSKIDAATALYGSGVKVPSRDEFQELLDNCELISHSRDYTIGRNVLTLKSKTTGNTLVLVGAGYYDVAGDNSSKPDIYFWVSTAVAGSNIDNYYFSAEAAQSKGMDKAIMLSKIYATTYAYQILPVFKAQDIVKASGVAINTDKCDMAVNDKLSLSVTVTPENTSNPALRWFSSDESVATVNGHGEVTAISAGECEITALTTDGSELSVSCLITVIEATQGMTFVDMGLSVKWGAHEIGAADYMSAGTYYAFGTIENANNYEAAVLGSYPVNSNGIAVTSVVRDPQDPAKPYDVATEILGSDWHTPNLDEWNELLDNTDISKEKVNGVTVHRLKSKINGNSILFTAHGYMKEISSSPQMSTSVILQTSNAPTNNIYTTINIVNPSVKHLARQTFWLVPIRPVMKNRSSGIDDVLSDNESDAPYNVFDLTGRCVAGQVSLQEGKLRLSHGVYIFVGRTGKRFKIAL